MHFASLEEVNTYLEVQAPLLRSRRQIETSSPYFPKNGGAGKDKSAKKDSICARRAQRGVRVRELVGGHPAEVYVRAATRSRRSFQTPSEIHSDFIIYTEPETVRPRCE